MLKSPFKIGILINIITCFILPIIIPDGASYFMIIAMASALICPFIIGFSYPIIYKEPMSNKYIFQYSLAIISVPIILFLVLLAFFGILSLMSNSPGVGFGFAILFIGLTGLFLIALLQCVLLFIIKFIAKCIIKY